MKPKSKLPGDMPFMPPFKAPSGEKKAGNKPPKSNPGKNTPNIARANKRRGPGSKGF